ncbi:AMIN-like domain-containing (lipo)protein [Geodermatophilus marinus]|uniref:AMIN-like domain-containing (lipo)protein n=1 Tax=Geodermatophilus sp. LHW52908 TaxID=2303986 RepID=UPI000E3E86B9|nr:hypothetical protein [Geodermatophilus sp. LHW52908]RFU22466.1 hypothetical protein D0Z06_04220 [Geodermatophilus sp. LHW52908]
MVRTLVAGLGAGALIAAPVPAAAHTQSTTTTTATTTVATTTAAPRPVGEAGTDPVVTDGYPGSGPTAHLADARAAGHDGFDRFVLEFERDALPGYRVEYVEPPVTEDPSGREVALAGRAVLRVQAAPASGVDLSGDEPRTTYPDRGVVNVPDGEVLLEAVQTGDFEGVLTWHLGLEERVPFGVTTLQDPARLVVDVRHPGGSPGGLEPFGPGGTDEVTADVDGQPVVLTDVRLGAHDGFDRVVFETAGGGEAGYAVGYTDDPRSQGSGAPVEVPGDATLGITLTGVTLPRDAPEGTEPWAGPERLEVAGTEALRALVTDGLYEGRYAFFAGLDERRPFAVTRLEDPARIVVDVLTTPPDEVRLAATCTSPGRWTVDHPADWSVNPGDVVPPCSRFARDDLDLEAGTDARVAPVVLRVEPAPFERVTEPRAGERERVELTLDGRPAVRTFTGTEGQGLYPAGTLITSYAVELAPGPDGPRTLVADAVQRPGSDHGYDTAVLDSMVRTLDLDPALTG